MGTFLNKDAKLLKQNKIESLREAIQEVRVKIFFHENTGCRPDHYTVGGENKIEILNRLGSRLSSLNKQLNSLLSE